MGLISWGIFGVSVFLMAEFSWLLVPGAIVVGGLMVASAIVYWVSTPPHLWRRRS